MRTQPNIRKAWLLPAAIAMLIGLAGCQPEGLVFDPQTGQWVSPLPTTTPPTSPLPTPTVTSGPTPTPYPTPWPPDFTPSPTPTPTTTPEGTPVVIYDPVNHFSLRLLPGWYATMPDTNAIGGATQITNYDINNTLPPGGLFIQISSGSLKPGQSFAQWLSEWRALETSPESGAFGVTLTEPQPYTLGRYEGVTFIKNSLSGAHVLEIDLLSGDGRVVVIGLTPADSSALPEALLMLSTLEISPQPLP